MKEPYPTYPIGLDYVMNAISPPHEVKTVDMNELKDERGLADVLVRFLPDVVGLSIRNIDNVDAVFGKSFVGEIGRLIEIVRRHSAAPIVLGGSGFTILPAEFMDRLDADYGIIGEGERLPLLLGALERRESTSGLPGIVSRKSPVVFPEPLADPYGRGLFPKHSYTSFYLKRGGMLNLQTKRGCPFRCIYCTYPLIEGRRFRFSDPKEVAQTAKGLEEAGAKYLYITDSTFNGHYGYSLEVARAFRREGVSIPWGAFFSPTTPPPDYYQVMADAGLQHVEFGTEALTDPVLEGYGKPFRTAEIFTSHRLAREAGLHIAHYLMLGGPGENEDTLKETLSRTDELDRTVFSVYVGARIYPRTALCELALTEGLISAGRNLLEPTFYWSPALSRERGMEWLENHSAGRPNWVVGSGPPGMFKVLARLHARGQVGPLWEHLVR